MKMCQAFTELGNSVDLITRGSKSSRINDYEYYGVQPEFSIHKINLNEIKYISSLIYIFYIYFKIKKLNPDLIYTRYRFSLSILSRYKIPIIFEDHSPPRGFYKLLINLILLKNNTKLVLISKELRKIYKTLFPDLNNSQIIVAHDGSDPIRGSNIKSNIIIDKSLFNCGYVGHLYKGRGIELIYEISKIMPNINFHIIGGNEKLISHWKSKIKQDNLIFHGYIQKSKVDGILLQFDILIAPFQKRVFLENGINTADWMSPLKIFDYMSAGKPIICSDIPVIKEVLINNRNALLIPPDDVDRWADSIAKLKNNKELCQTLGSNALSDFMQYHTWKIRAKNILLHAKK